MYSSKQSSLLNWYKQKENFLSLIGFTSWLPYHVADHVSFDRFYFYLMINIPHVEDHVFLTKGSQWQHIIPSLYLAYLAVSIYTIKLKADLEFVKKITRPNFWAKEFNTLKTRKSRLFLLAINTDMEFVQNFSG